ncbi:MAG TPA: hypothetical protein VKI17_04635, partial [Gemmataceae bacterium]|nr:hypothetical protein [Gemmataceae bacterium]
MRKLLVHGSLLTMLALLAGCSSGTPTEVEDKPQTSKLGDAIDISLSDLLTRPRSELAEMADELTTKIHIQEKGRRVGSLNLSLLGDFRLPLVVPVWREARYSASAGFSLPPYFADGKDSKLALHVARYGDLEAARKLVEPGDTETVRHIEACALEQNYPLEWTRLAGLHLHAGQIRLATGDVDGATEIVVFHRQLRSLFGSKAMKSPLGASLLARGRETLERAAKAWQEDKKTDLAGQARAALDEWGELAPPPLALRQEMERAELERALRARGEGACLQPQSTLRALDVLELPFPDEGAEAVLACLDKAGRLQDVFITYKAGLGEYFPEPEDFAHLFEESQMAGKPGPKSTGLRGRAYSVDSWTCEVTLVNHGAGMGALVHFGTGKEPQPWKALDRDFGVLNLDRSFDQTRFLCAPEHRKDSLVVSQPNVLKQVANPLTEFALRQVVIDRTKERDLVSRFAIEYKVGDAGCPPMHQVALPLWTSLGVPRLEGAEDSQGGHLALIWEDPRTRYSLWLPYESGQSARLDVSDQQSPDRVAEREAAAVALDRKERVSRVKTGKSVARLPRQLDQFDLGASRAQISELLPTGQAVLKREAPGMLMVTFTGEPGRDDKYVIRQLFVRFDNEDHAGEIRIRYVGGNGPGNPSQWMTEILNGFKKRAGAPLETPAPWASVWSDVSGRKSAARCYQWRDDTTELSYQFDAGGAEVCLQDRPFDASYALPAFEYLARGTAGCLLGMPRDTLLQNL